MPFFDDQPCGDEHLTAEDIEMGLWPWSCTLERGHSGDHEAHGISNLTTPFATWPNANH